MPSQTFTDTYGDKLTVGGNYTAEWVELTTTEDDDSTTVEFKAEEAPKIALAILEAATPTGIVTPAMSELRDQIALSNPKAEVTVEVTEEVVEEVVEETATSVIEEALKSLRNNLTAFEMFGHSYASCTPLEKKLIEFGLFLTDEFGTKK